VLFNTEKRELEISPEYELAISSRFRIVALSRTILFPNFSLTGFCMCLGFINCVSSIYLTSIATGTISSEFDCISSDSVFLISKKFLTISSEYFVFFNPLSINWTGRFDIEELLSPSIKSISTGSYAEREFSTIFFGVEEEIILNFPVEISHIDIYVSFFELNIASTLLSLIWFAWSPSSVPGVTILVTPRFTIPLASLGSSN